MFKRLIVVCVLVALVLPQVSQAAALYIDPAISELYRGDAVTLNVRLDVDEERGECVNAIDGVLSYSAALDPVDISLGDSIVSLWPEQPQINRDEQTITFAGGIPNGYCGRVEGDPRLTNTLLKLVFRLPSFAISGGDMATATVAFTEQTGLYLNDGRGTRVAPNMYPATIALRQESSSDLQNDWQAVVDADNANPESFSVTVERIPAETGDYYAIFSTTDKQTGIDQYQIMEESLVQYGSFQWGRADAPWITAASPYRLKDQSLNSIIRVKAIDKAGNQYIANYIPDESMRTISQMQLLLYVGGAALVLLVVVIGVTVWLFLRRAKKRRAETVDLVASEIEDHE